MKAKVYLLMHIQIKQSTEVFIFIKMTTYPWMPIQLQNGECLKVVFPLIC